MIRRQLFRFLVSVATSFFVIPATVEAGPPLICQKFEIGNARSLPWDTVTGNSPKKDYDLNRLVQDTVALLNTDTPVIVRMETLRRAALYAKEDQGVAKELLSALLARAESANAKSRPDPLAEFDAGYWVETYKQANLKWEKRPDGKYDPVVQPNPAADVDGYARVVKAINLRRQDPEMEFAAALITALPRNRSHEQHVRMAGAGATEGSLLAKNMDTHLSHEDRAIAK